MAVPPPQINFYEPTIYEPCGCSEIAPNSACCVEGNCCCMPKRKDYSAVNKKVKDLQKDDELIAFGKVLAVSATYFLLDGQQYRAVATVRSDQHRVIIMEENAEVAVRPTGILPGQSWTSEKVLRVKKPDLSSPEARESLVWLAIQTTGGAFTGIYVKRADLREALLQVNLSESS